MVLVLVWVLPSRTGSILARWHFEVIHKVYNKVIHILIFYKVRLIGPSRSIQVHPKDQNGFGDLRCKEILNLYSPCSLLGILENIYSYCKQLTSFFLESSPGCFQ
ncbi:hypothetical protein GOODEAATRI_015421 [Goodea atripinnis]|uniref:Maturase K n=1 Tax=Goodea atripinnis TaxID=208336 RepID=A0ABV0N1M3_9TELE